MYSYLTVTSVYLWCVQRLGTGICSGSTHKITGSGRCSASRRLHFTLLLMLYMVAMDDLITSIIHILRNVDIQSDLKYIAPIPIDPGHLDAHPSLQKIFTIQCRESIPRGNLRSSLTALALRNSILLSSRPAASQIRPPLRLFSKRFRQSSPLNC